MSSVLPVPGDWAIVNKVPGPAGGLIRRLQILSGGGARAARWVHAIYLVADGVIVEAEPGGARRVPFHYAPGEVWWSTGIIVKSDQARAASIAAAEGFAAANGGKGIGYSFLDYAAIAAHDWHIPAPGLRAYIESSGHQICSQLCDSAELAGGTHLFSDGRWPGFCRPADLALLTGAP
jgi:uncharacterized protein YycO